MPVPSVQPYVLITQTYLPIHTCERLVKELRKDQGFKGQLSTTMRPGVGSGFLPMCSLSVNCVLGYG